MREFGVDDVAAIAALGMIVAIIVFAVMGRHR